MGEEKKGHEKSPVDELFHELYGYYPNKRGQAYEMLVAAGMKLLMGKEVSYNQFERGKYSDTTYQQDGVVEDDEKMIEAKDYTNREAKVGRGDLQKLQGALGDLIIKGGIFASATDYTKPAKNYAKSGEENPLHKPIELFHVRPSVEEDKEGRAMKIVLDIHIQWPDYENSKMTSVWTKEAAKKLEEGGHVGKQWSQGFSKFYDKEGKFITSIYDLTKNHPPTPPEGLYIPDNYVAKGMWKVPGGCIDLEEEKYEIAGIKYEVPFIELTEELVIEGGGEPKMYIRSEDGKHNKLITDEQLRNIEFKDGKVIEK